MTRQYVQRTQKSPTNDDSWILQRTAVRQLPAKAKTPQVPKESLADDKPRIKLDLTQIPVSSHERPVVRPPLMVGKARDTSGQHPLPALPELRNGWESPNLAIHNWEGGQAMPVQAKLTIGQPHDKYEQEAERVASQVVQQINAPASTRSTQGQSVQRQSERSEEELQAIPDITSLQDRKEPARKVQTKLTLQGADAIASGEASSELTSAINSARGGGQPLEAGLQQSMGQAMGVDFSGVRVHTDARSDQLNRSIQAKAFTTGQDLFFQQGEYQPGTRGGQETIAHELTHVVQQNGGGWNYKARPGIIQRAPNETRDNETRDNEEESIIARSMRTLWHMLTRAWTGVRETQREFDAQPRENEGSVFMKMEEAEQQTLLPLEPTVIVESRSEIRDDDNDIYYSVESHLDQVGSPEDRISVRSDNQRSEQDPQTRKDEYLIQLGAVRNEIQNQSDAPHTKKEAVLALILDIVPQYQVAADLLVNFSPSEDMANTAYAVTAITNLGSTLLTLKEIKEQLAFTKPNSIARITNKILFGIQGLLTAAQVYMAQSNTLFDEPQYPGEANVNPGEPSYSSIDWTAPKTLWITGISIGVMTCATARLFLSRYITNKAIAEKIAQLQAKEKDLNQLISDLSDSIDQESITELE